jgi:ABC-type transporter Mla subunit MlaD
MPLQDLTPQLRTRLNRMEKAVGWFVFIAAALMLSGFGYYLYHTADRKGWFKAKAEFVTYLQTSTGLKVGDPVYLMGFQVGNITLVHPRPPGEARNVEVQFEVQEPYFRYIWSRGSFVKINGGLLGQSQLEVTRATNGYAMAVTQPIVYKPVSELEQLVAAEPGRWQLSQFVYDSKSNVVMRPYAELTTSNLQALAAMGLESTSLYAYNNTVNRKHVVAVWRTNLNRYDVFDHEHDAPVELPAQESVPIGDRIDKMVGQIEQALPGILALTNKLAVILDNTANATSNLNSTLVTVQPMMTNFALISTQLREPGGPLLWALGTNGNVQLQGTLTNLNSLLGNADTNLNQLTAQISTTLENVAGITSNLHAQVDANTNIVGNISKIIVDTDDFVQGLKRHWLLRSAFKTKETNAPATTVKPLQSPRAATN